jgi:hypothetical protein
MYMYLAIYVYVSRYHHIRRYHKLCNVVLDFEFLHTGGIATTSTYRYVMLCYGAPITPNLCN